jgi:prolyl-tRNA synthetase
MRGVPVRLEVGPRDVANAAVMSVRRDNRAKESIPLDRLAERLPALLAELQQALFQAALEFRDQNLARASNLEEIEAHFAERRGFVAMPWKDDPKLEALIKERTGATLRCFPLPTESSKQLGGDGVRLAVFARSY